MSEAGPEAVQVVHGGVTYTLWWEFSDDALQVRYKARCHAYSTYVCEFRVGTVMALGTPDAELEGLWCQLMEQLRLDLGVAEPDEPFDCSQLREGGRLTSSESVRAGY